MICNTPVQDQYMRTKISPYIGRNITNFVVEVMQARIFFTSFEKIPPPTQIPLKNFPTQNAHAHDVVIQMFTLLVWFYFKLIFHTLIPKKTTSTIIFADP